jgi:alpha-L-fucosidase
VEGPPTNCSHQKTRKKLPVLLASCLWLTQPLASHAQLYTAGNYAAIPAGSSSSTIIEKAAEVVPSPRQLRWQQLELTGFLHFGMNTFTNKEWGDGTESPSLFNPTSLDAGQWVKTCKDGGIKQVIITAKHHDGFCLWPSKYTEHSVKSSPWKGGKGDVVKEVADACHAQGLRRVPVALGPKFTLFRRFGQVQQLLR